MSEAHEGEQLALLRAGVKRTRKPTGVTPAKDNPIARIVVDLPLSHLDRPFDYTVPEKYETSCVPGARVRVRFAGREVDGYVLERVAESEHTGRLAPIRRVVSAEPVVAPTIKTLARLVADRYAGTMADVLRLAIPPRHARVEAEPPREPAPDLVTMSGDPESDDPESGSPESDEWGPWDSYDAGAAFLRAVRAGEAPRAVWLALPGSDWATGLAHAAAAALASGRGALLIVPDQRDITRLDAACAAVLGESRHVTLTAELGPAERYRRFLAVRRGAIRCVVGTRAAAFAPVADLGLVACWDDGDDSHAEQRAPYPHAREVLLVRAQEQGAAALIGGFACTAESAQLLASGWARPIAADRALLRDRVPRISVTGDTDTDLARDPAARAARIPNVASEAVRDALARGPVLVQVPRTGYVPSLACQDCRTSARCEHCAGPLALDAKDRPPSCQWCGRLAPTWRCRHCGGTSLRAPIIGSRRTAEELGRAFPSVPVRTSGGPRVLDEVSDEPALVIATPGAEPVAAGGYAAALLLDTWLLLARRDLRAGEEAVRRWLGAAALVRGRAEGGVVVVVGEPSVPALQTLVRWSPLAFAERELAERRAAGFPPAVRLATLEGARDAVTDLARTAELPESAEVLGPVVLTEETELAGPDDVEEEVVRLVVRVPNRDGAALAAALKAAQGVRSARKADKVVRVRMNPRAIG